MVLYEEALDSILQNVSPLGSTYTNILDIESGFLYEDIYAPSDMPRFSNSAIDGYAIRSRDTISASTKKPSILRIRGTIRTGVDFIKRLREDEAYAISTGSAIPPGSDAVVMKEDVKVYGKHVYIFRKVKRGENIRFRGEDFKRDAKILKRGTELTPAVKGLLISLGINRVRIFKSPKITFISSGSELVEPGHRLRRNQIYNSNYYSIKGLLNKSGIPLQRHLSVKDDIHMIVEALREAFREADVVIISGGISVGEVDYVKEALRLLKVDEIFWRVKIKPGKPLFFGKKGEKIVFGLPGNPVSSFVNTVLFVLPALKKMVGSNEYYNKEVEAIFANNFIKYGDRKEFLRGRYIIKNGRYYVYVSESQGSHILSSLADSNCLVITDYRTRAYSAGERGRIYLL